MRIKESYEDNIGKTFTGTIMSLAIPWASERQGVKDSVTVYAPNAVLDTMQYAYTPNGQRRYRRESYRARN